MNWYKGRAPALAARRCRSALPSSVAAATAPGHPAAAQPLINQRTSGESVKCPRSTARRTRSTSGLCTTPSCGGSSGGGEAASVDAVWLCCCCSAGCPGAGPQTCLAPAAPLPGCPPGPFVRMQTSCRPSACASRRSGTLGPGHGRPAAPAGCRPGPRHRWRRWPARPRRCCAAGARGWRAV